MDSSGSPRSRAYPWWWGYLAGNHGYARLSGGESEAISRDSALSSAGWKEETTEKVGGGCPASPVKQGGRLAGKGGQCCCSSRLISEESAPAAVPSGERDPEPVGEGGEKVGEGERVVYVVRLGWLLGGSTVRQGLAGEDRDGVDGGRREAGDRRCGCCDCQGCQLSIAPPSPEREGRGAGRGGKEGRGKGGGVVVKEGGGEKGGHGAEPESGGRLGGGGGGEEVGRWWSSGTVKGVLIWILVFVLLQYWFLKFSECMLSRANAFGRECHKPHDGRQYGISDGRFAIVTCSDGASTIPKRSFQGLAEMVTPNKESYVKKHGYDFIDASDIMDRKRPPSWSKILAVQKHLHSYDWVFWTDADSVVTNPDVTLQEVIGSAIATGSPPFSRRRSRGSPSSSVSVLAGGGEETSAELIVPDFIVTEDHNGVNAGMFFIRNSSWSHKFLELWWSQSDFVRPFGRCKSGDNDALKHLIDIMDDAERRLHVRVPEMQCAFNSNLWRPSVRGSKRLLLQFKAVWRGVFAKGDFMVHLAGVDNKKKYVSRVLQELDRANERAAMAAMAGAAPQGMTWQDAVGGRLRRWRRKIGWCQQCADQTLS